ncbi:O-antigen ligase family protein [Streptomyces sp. CA-288835]|uniref:O-antigen ligase family protein n=1 Tax=Streptomyces sp. CA-288835 TaxID=3240069 RepID=UPI003D90D24C
MLALFAAAMPLRIPMDNPVFHSISILDIILCFAAVTLALDCALHPLNIGYRPLFTLLCVPLLVCGISVAWSQDRFATLRATTVYAEGIIAYLFVLRELGGASPTRVIVYVKRYSYLLIIPAVLLLLHVPGFAPQEPDLPRTSGDYLSYYSRLSHPVLGRSNNLATVLAFFVPLLFYWGHARHDRRFMRAGWITLVAVVCTMSRGVIFALLAVALIAALSSLIRSRWIDSRTVGKIAAGVAVVTTAIVFFQRFNPSARKFISERFSESNITIRSDLARKALGEIAARPLLGYGGGVAPDRDRRLPIDVHNTYLQQMVYFGLLLGLVVSLVLIGTAIFFFSRWRIGTINRVIGFSLMAQMLIFLTESSFEGTVLRVIFYMSIGLAAALARACEGERRGEGVSAPVPRHSGLTPGP